MQLSILIGLAGIVSGQQLYSTVDNAKTSRAPVSPTYKQSSFAYSQSTTVRYASPMPTPATVSYYASHYKDLEHLIGQVSTTTWGNWEPNATAKPTDTNDPYGQAAFSSMWEAAGTGVAANFSRGTYSSTVEPTPVPSGELVLPPSDPFSFRDDLTFPSDFMLGVAGSASQIEGAVADEGRTPSIQEVLTEDNGQPNNFVTNENYYLYKQDIARMAAMGVKYYSFTIPWSRILPFVLPGTPVNQQAIDHYDDLINTVLEYGMEPVVTLMHFDSPLMFLGGKPARGGDYDLSGQSGGYDNDTFVDAFVNYGKIVMTHFADRVPVWVTINEPFLYAANAQGIKNVIMAHAKMYKFYHDEIKGCGQVGIKFNNNFGVPLKADDKDHLAATQRFQEFQLGALCNPIFLGQDYPQSWTDMWKDSKYKFQLSKKELEYVSHTSDFFGIDPYTITVISPIEGGMDTCISNKTDPNWPICVNQTMTDVNGWAVGYRSHSYVYITPTYFRSFLNYLWNTFKSPVLVGEFGFPEWMEQKKELKDQLFDTDRSVYYRSYLNSILEAIHYDNVHVLGAFAWSFADNWEFGDYSQQFGIQVVNRTTQERFFKKSFFDFVDFYRQRSP